MYNPGQVYIWQHQRGPYAVLNETECTVMSEWHDYKDDAGTWRQGVITDTPSPNGPDFTLYANAGDLRPRHLPLPATRKERDVTVTV